MNGFRSEKRSRKISSETSRFDKYTNYVENNRKDVITEYNDRKYFLKKNNYEKNKIIINKKIEYNEFINNDLNKDFIKVTFIYKAIYNCY